MFTKKLSFKIDLKVVLLCVIVATTFWVFNALNNSYTANVTYPLELEYDTTKYVRYGNYSNNIRLNVSGYGWNLIKTEIGFKQDPIVIQINRLPKSDIIDGQSFFGTISEQLNDVKVNYVSQDTLYLNLDYKVNKIVTLGVNDGNLQEDYYIKSYTFNPKEVRISGPERLVDQVSKRYKIDFKDVNAGKSLMDANHDLRPYFSKDIVIKPSVCEARIEIDHYVELALQVKIVYENFPSAVLKLQPERTVSIICKVASADKNTISPNDFKVSANYYNKTEDNKVRLRVRDYPEIVKSYQFTDPVITISIK